MVNMQEFSKRLQQIFDYYGLNASAFADKIDVGRASISHLLSGRNKPSLDFVMRVIKTFPEVELYWLLNGKGNFPADSPTNSPTATKAKNISANPPNNIENTESKIPEQSIDKQLVKKGEIERIVIFYKNGLFKTYTPE